jgi:phage repressor protein C with HTH and peptisase S24 domain
MDESEEGFTKVPVYDVACSAGNGVVIDSEHVLYHLSFRTQWLKSISSAPIDKMAVIRVEGDSMQPTLSHDDTVLIDMTQTYPRGDGVYVVVYDGMLLVKRVRIDPVRNVAEILSDNPCYSPVTGLVPDQIRVAGRVIWLGRRV